MLPLLFSHFPFKIKYYVWLVEQSKSTETIAAASSSRDVEIWNTGFIPALVISRT